MCAVLLCCVVLGCHAASAPPQPYAAPARAKCSRQIFAPKLPGPVFNSGDCHSVNVAVAAAVAFIVTVVAPGIVSVAAGVVLCCDVMCCVVLCVWCIVLCCVVLSGVVLCCVGLCCVVLLRLLSLPLLLLLLLLPLLCSYCCMAIAAGTVW